MNVENLQRDRYTEERLPCRCMLGQNYTIARRKPETRCFNGRDYERRNSTGACECQAVSSLLPAPLKDTCTLKHSRSSLSFQSLDVSMAVGSSAPASVMRDSSEQLHS